MGQDSSTLEELEIVAGHVWSAVGGVDQGSVEVKQVDPKRFGVEVAAGTKVTWLPGQEGDTKPSTLSTLRAFKPMDIMVIERLVTPTAVSIISGATDIATINIGGVQQFTSEQPVSSAVFGTVLSAPRPKIRFDTVQTSPALTAQMTLAVPTIAASQSITADIIFGGVAVKR